MGKMSSEQASQKKELGHAEERTFNAFFGDKNKRATNFSSSTADNEITKLEFKKKITDKLGILDSYKVSLKSGDTWQFHLGRIDQLSPLSKIKIEKTLKNETRVVHSIPFKKQQSVLSNYDFWKNYFGKGDLLCYNDKKKIYTFFRMDSVINFICNNVKWRLKDTGRIKGDILYQNKNRAVLTFEYRNTKNQFALGAMGGKNGLLLFEILKYNIDFCEIKFDAIIENKNNIVIPKDTFKKGLKGKIGDTFFDDNYFYICIDENSWKRIKLETIV
jgi:hypothetical protein